MSKFNQFMNAHFSGSGCRLIARARDTCRNRTVTIHAIPGYFDCVGISDGTDAWIAPTSTGPFFKTSTGDVTQIMRALQAGEPLPPVPDAARHRVALIDSDPKPEQQPMRSTRRALLS